MALSNVLVKEESGTLRKKGEKARHTPDLHNVSMVVGGVSQTCKETTHRLNV